MPFLKGGVGYWTGKKRPRSNEWQEKINKAHIGLKRTKETKQKEGQN